MNDQELAALKGAADGERFGRALVVLHAYGQAFSDAMNAALAPLREALAQMPHAPATTAVERPSGPGEGEPYQTPHAATGHTEGGRDRTGGQP